MTKSETGTLLRFALVLALATSVHSLQPLSASEEKAEANCPADAEMTDPDPASEPTEAGEEGEPELIDVSEIIPLLEEEGFNSESLARLGNGGQLSHFDGGGFLFVNSSEMKVAIQMGEIRFELDPDQGKLLHPIASHKGGACQVTLSYQCDEDWKVFRKTRWMTSTRYRSLIYFHQDPGTKQIMVSPVVDVLPYEPSTAE